MSHALFYRFGSLSPGIAPGGAFGARKDDVVVMEASRIGAESKYGPVGC